MDDYGYGSRIATGACYVALILTGLFLTVLYVTPPPV